jgi:hypothetical protein
MNCRSLYRTAATGIAAAGIALVHAAALDAQGTVPASEIAAGTATASVVDIIAEDYALSAPAEIPSGWTTFRFRNEGKEPHFVLISRLPAGITIEDYQTDLSTEFVRAWYAVRDGEMDEEEAMARLFGNLPDWFAGLDFLGGPGLIAPGLSSETTLNLEPGNYVLECYMKTEDGEFHYMEGMIRPIRITETRSAAAPPEADIRITLSNFTMDIEGDLRPGRHVVEVHIAENPEQGFGHNVHVARMSPTMEVSEVVRWMNAFELDGLSSPGPVTFIGGAQIMPAGHTAYFTLDLEPGSYLFVSEYTGNMGVLKEVTVTP